MNDPIGIENEFTQRVEAAGKVLGVTVVCRRVSHVPGPGDEFKPYVEYQAWCRERAARWFFTAESLGVEGAILAKLYPNER